MKKIIITKSQLNEIMDSKKTVVTFTGNNANEMGTNAQEKYNDAIKAGLTPSSIALQGKSINNNASDKDEIEIAFDSNKSNIKDAVTSSVQQAVSNGVDINKVVAKDNTEDVTNGVSEMRSFSKKNVEIARLHEMRKNGRVLTKKQLTEEILGENIENLIRNKNVFEVLQAFGDVFGNNALQSLSNCWNMSEKIVEAYNNATPEEQEAFKKALDGDEEPIDLDLDVSNI